jgi:long-chain acyl-CoA synthetase
VVICSSKVEKLLKSTDLSHFRINALIVKSPTHGWSRSPLSVTSWDEILRDIAHPNPLTPIEESALASIIYTSGSTGKPKGVMLSHKNIVSNTTSICHYLHLNQRDVQMVVLPFFYVMGKSLLNTHFAVGGTVVINNKFAYPASVLKQMVEEQVTSFSGVPATYAYLLHRSPLGRYRDKLGSLRYCSQAGGHMSRQIKRELQNVLPAHTKIFIMYGATEASARLTYLDPDRFTEKLDSIGKPISGVSLRILDATGREAPTGQTGELVGGGPGIMQGYWKDVEATSRVLDENGYHTGDLGYQDEDGYFYVLGRKDNLLKVGGHRINPQEIEDVLMETGLVIEAAVLGVPNTIMGNSLLAVLTPKNGDCSETEIFRRLAARLPKYKLPSRLRFLRTLPKSASGKIDKNKLINKFRHEGSAPQRQRFFDL